MGSSTSTVRREAPSAPTWLALLLVVLSLAVAGAAVVAVAGRSDEAPTPVAEAPVASEVLPSSLAGLPATVHLNGPEAVEAVTSLHIGDVPADAAEVADYGGGQIVVWVAWSASEDAATLVERMTDRIAEGGTPFAIPVPAERPEGAFMTRGIGQVHYYWAQDGGVWWIAADRALAQGALDELVGGEG